MVGKRAEAAALEQRIAALQSELSQCKAQAGHRESLNRWAKAGVALLILMLGYVAGTGSRELFTLSVIAVAMGIAYASAALFDVSFALGAFFAGMVMRESPLSHRAAEESLPFRDAFSVLF
mgnify:CR=1 FL=1